MLTVNQLAGFGAGAAGGPSLIRIITELGLTGGLKLCLDAGDLNSWPGSGQKWLDTSGGGHDFFRGAGSGSDASDPTFNGTPGAGSASEYWSFDGGDFFIHHTSNPAWVDALHKNNALFTLFFVFYAKGSSGAFFSSFATGSSENGIFFNANMEFRVAKSSGALALSTVTGTTKPTVNAWNTIALSVNESVGAGGGFFWLNGAYSQVAGSNTFNCTYATPSSGATSNPFTLGVTNSTGSSFFSNGERLAAVAAWEGVSLLKANLDDIRARLQTTRPGL